MEEQEGVKVVALCDPDRSRLASATKRFEQKYHHTPDQCADMRKLLDRKDVDVLSHATQTYWHCLGAIWSCQAGKHVYVEKPASQYLWEGRQAVNAARKYNRIVQCGTQERSIRGTKAAIQWVRAGNLGKIKLITAFCYKERFSVGKRDKPLEIPPEVDYDLWCGPAKKVPLYRDKLHYDCCFDWNTGGGDAVNQGAHQVDVARWLLGENDLPRRVMSIGGRFVFNDAADCPNTQIIYYDFPSAPVLYEMYDLRVAKGSNKIPKFMGETVGAYVTCEGGSILLRHGARVFDKDGKEFKTLRRRPRSAALRELHRGRAQPRSREASRRDSRRAYLGRHLPHRQHLSPARQEGFCRRDSPRDPGNPRLERHVRAVRGPSEGQRGRRGLADDHVGPVVGDGSRARAFQGQRRSRRAGEGFLSRAVPGARFVDLNVAGRLRSEQ